VRQSFLLFLLGLLVAGPLAADESEQGWKQLKVGMSAVEAATLLGDPILVRRGYGFETWTYDGGSEVLFHKSGTIVGWTAPASAQLTRRSEDLWSTRPKGKYYPTMHAALRELVPLATANKPLIRALKALPVAVAPTPTPATGMGYEALLRQAGRKG
jgi:hypothetical protein